MENVSMPDPNWNGHPNKFSCSEYKEGFEFEFSFPSITLPISFNSSTPEKKKIVKLKKLIGTKKELRHEIGNPRNRKTNPIDNRKRKLKREKL